MIKVEAIKWTDIKGKELMYLKLTKEGQEPLLINVGEKTFNAVQAMTEVKEEPKKGK